ncbi:hypothetical protein BDV25DRAFT_162817, partial [Aspergillus avenaceus]
MSTARLPPTPSAPSTGTAASAAQPPVRAITASWVTLCTSMTTTPRWLAPTTAGLASSSPRATARFPPSTMAI